MDGKEGRNEERHKGTMQGSKWTRWCGLKKNNEKRSTEKKENKMKGWIERTLMQGRKWMERNQLRNAWMDMC
jgi:hypothetical protein